MMLISGIKQEHTVPNKETNLELKSSSIIHSLCGLGLTHKSSESQILRLRDGGRHDQLTDVEQSDSVRGGLRSVSKGGPISVHEETQVGLGACPG